MAAMLSRGEKGSKPLEQSYFSVSRYFDTWVRLMEIRTRTMEAEDSAHLQGARVLIISPPTDAGIPLLVRANRTCQTRLLCFSERLGRIAATYAKKHRVNEVLDISVAPFFRLPFPDGEFAAIYANCFLDFCHEGDLDAIFDEMHRALGINGSLFAAYMGHSNKFPARGWTWAFRRCGFISQGCHPVSVGPYLSRHGFSVRRDLSASRLGFPLRYTLAEKQ